LIVHWVTPDLGRVATVAKGARRPKSPFRGKLDLFFTADFTLLRSRRSDLHTLREVSLLQTRSGFRRDLSALERASYAAQFLESVTETETPIPELHQIFSDCLTEIERRPDSPEVVLAYELKMLAELGLAPDLAAASLSEGSRRIAAHLAASPWSGLVSLKLSPAQAAEVRQFLHGFLTHHLDRIPRGRGPAVTTKPSHSVRSGGRKGEDGGEVRSD